MSGGVPHHGGLPAQTVRVTRFAGVSFLHVKGAEWAGVIRRVGVIKSLELGELFRRFHLQNRQNAHEIDIAGDNLGMESDSQANQRNQTKVLPATTTLKRKAALWNAIPRLMIFIFIIYRICGGYIITRGDFLIIFGT